MPTLSELEKVADAIEARADFSVIRGLGKERRASQPAVRARRMVLRASGDGSGGLLGIIASMLVATFVAVVLALNG